MNVHDQVLEFMRAFRRVAGDVPEQAAAIRPTVPGFDVLEMRLRLIVEELDEYREATRRALAADTEEKRQSAFVAVADALADLHYVVAGAGIVWGLPMREVADVVHRANMRKLGPGVQVREDGKILKPAGWTPPEPEIDEIVRRAR